MGIWDIDSIRGGFENHLEISKRVNQQISPCDGRRRIARNNPHFDVG